MEHSIDHGRHPIHQAHLCLRRQAITNFGRQPVPRVLRTGTHPTGHSHRLVCQQGRTRWHRRWPTTGTDASNLGKEEERESNTRLRGQIESFCVILNLTTFVFGLIYIRNSGNPAQKEVGFKITSYILVLLTKKKNKNKKLSSHGSSHNCMKI